MTHESNLVQVEFLHIEISAKRSIGEAVSEAFSRAMEGSELSAHGIPTFNGLKTTVRFYDSTSELTRLAVEFEALEDAFIHGLSTKEAYGARNFFTQWLHVRDMNRIVRRKRQIKKKILSISQRLACVCIKKREEIAVEYADGTLALAERNLLHELRERILRGRHVLVFVFKPNTILSARNEIIASIL